MSGVRRYLDEYHAIREIGRGRCHAARVAFWVTMYRSAS